MKNDRNKDVRIVVAEPWDFKTDDGKNIINGTILSFKTEELIIFKSKYLLKFGEMSGDVLLLVPRLQNGKFNETKEVHVNGFLLLGLYNEDLTQNQLLNNCKFAIIGTLWLGKE